MLQLKLTIGLIVCGLVIQTGCKPESAYQAPGPPRVVAVKPEIDTVPIFLEENGQTEAVEQAVVLARVRGILQEIKFKPDSEVTEGTPGTTDEPGTPGTLLFQIEKQEYEAIVRSRDATVKSAKAELASANAAIGIAQASIDTAKAEIDVATAELGRISKLKENDAVSQSEFDAALANVARAKAALKGAEADQVAKNADITNAEAKVAKALADLANAQLDLDRTDIFAPISGRVTKAMVKRGSMVENGTPLVEIVKDNPIWANFSINERFLLKLERESNRADGERDLSKIRVQLQRSGDVGFPFEGHLDYADPKIDQDTGTLQLRAVFENPRGKSNLRPGLFVRVRVQIGQYDTALLIPERAIGRDQVGSFVYVVDSENKAVRKNVMLGVKHKGKIVIESGLDPGDSVIVDGIQRVRAGIDVNPG